MYFNDVHILYYLAFGLFGLLMGEFLNWCNKCLPEYKKIFSKEIVEEYRREFKPHYILMLSNAVIYLCLLHKFGIQDTIIENLDLIKYIILTPMLLSAFVIDYRLQIIPNRLVLTMFEIGLVFTFIYGLIDINISTNMLLGMFTGGGIFLLITLIGGLIAGKEAMGFGDVKLMGVLRSVFWI